jgi:hypothetical protein
MKSVGSHGSLSLLFMMKFMTAVIVILPQFFVFENPLQFHIYICILLSMGLAGELVSLFTYHAYG